MNMSFPFSDFGDFIKKLRETKDLTISEVGSKSNLSAATISRIEQGRSQFTVGTVVKICFAFELNLTDLQPFVLLPILELKAMPDESLPSLSFADLETYRCYYAQNRAMVERLIEELTGLIWWHLLEPSAAEAKRYHPPAAVASLKLAQSTLAPSKFVKIVGDFPPGYPQQTSNQLLDNLFEANAILDLPDLGQYVRYQRQAGGITFREIHDRSGIRANDWQRTEQGILKNLKFENLLNIDRVLGGYGDVLGLAWDVFEFLEGIRKARWEIESTLTEGYSDQDIDQMRTLLNLSRWFQVLQPERDEWLQEIRTVIGGNQFPKEYHHIWLRKR